MLSVKHVIQVYERLRREAELVGQRLGRLDRALCRLEVLLPDNYVYRARQEDDHGGGNPRKPR